MPPTNQGNIVELTYIILSSVALITSLFCLVCMVVAYSNVQMKLHRALMERHAYLDIVKEMVDDKVHYDETLRNAERALVMFGAKE